MKVIRKYSDPEGLKQSLSHYPDIVRFIQKEWLALFDEQHAPGIQSSLSIYKAKFTWLCWNNMTQI